MTRVLIELEPPVTVGQRIGSRVVANDVARAGEAVFVGDDAVQADRAAGVQLAGADANLGTEAVAEAVGEAGGTVVEDVGGVDLGEEARGGGGVAGDDGVGVVRAVLLDMVEGVVERVDDADGEDEVGVLGVPLVSATRSMAACGQQGAGAFVSRGSSRIFLRARGRAKAAPRARWPRG